MRVGVYIHIMEFFQFNNISACLFFVTSRFLTKMREIIEEMFFSIIKGDNFVRGSSLDCSI